MSDLIKKYDYDMKLKLDNFEKYVRRQRLGRFIVRYELFKNILDVKGSIVECGVYYGGGLMAWAKLSATFEPYAVHRKIIGFDSFAGFPVISKKDSAAADANPEMKESGFSTKADVYGELQECIREFDENRYLSHSEKVELVRGDAVKTIPEYVKKNGHLVVALLFLDFDLYEPTKAALTHLLPRVPKGGIVAFDELNNRIWPGETAALLEEFKSLNGLEIRKFSFDHNISYVRM